MHHGIGSSRSLLRGARCGKTALPSPRGHARGGRGSLLGLEQIKSKERNCRLSKSSSSAIIRHRAGSRWWWRREWREAPGRTDRQVGLASGPQDSEATTPTCSDPDPKSVPTPPGGRVRLGHPTRRRRLFTVRLGSLSFPHQPPRMGAGGGVALGLGRQGRCGVFLCAFDGQEREGGSRGADPFHTWGN